MKLSREVITDLWPVYRSGEASADTVALVEQFLKDDPEFEQLIREGEGAEMLNHAAAVPSADQEMRALNATRRRLRVQRFLMGFAIFFTLSPLSGAVTSRGVNWVFVRDAPVVAALFFGVGLCLWIAYYVTGKGLRVRGF